MIKARQVGFKLRGNCFDDFDEVYIFGKLLVGNEISAGIWLENPSTVDPKIAAYNLNFFGFIEIKKFEVMCRDFSAIFGLIF